MALLTSINYVRESARIIANMWLYAGKTLILGSLFNPPVSPVVPQLYIASDATGPTQFLLDEALDPAFPATTVQGTNPLVLFRNRLLSGIFQIEATGDLQITSPTGFDRNVYVQVEHIDAATKIALQASTLSQGVVVYGVGGPAAGLLVYGLLFGASTPETFVTAPVGFRYIAADGHMYVKATGTGNTGWVDAEPLPPFIDTIAHFYHSGAPTSTARFVVGATGPYVYTLQALTGKTVALDGVLTGATKGKIVAGNGSNTTDLSAAPALNEMPLISDTAQATGVRWGYATSGAGAGSALLGATCPATFLTAPYAWVKSKAPDGTVCTIPMWKM